MNKSMKIKGTKNYDLGDVSDSSSEASNQNNKERMKSLKDIYRRRGSLMEYLNNLAGPKDL